VTDSTLEFQSKPNRLRNYIDRVFETAAKAIIKARLFRSNVDQLMETVIRAETAAEAKTIVPTVGKRLEDQLMDLSRDGIREEIERRLGNQPLDIIIRNAIDGALAPLLQPLTTKAISDADHRLDEIVERAIVSNLDARLNSFLKKIVEENVGKEGMTQAFRQAVRELAKRTAGMINELDIGDLVPPVTGRKKHHFQFSSILEMVIPRDGTERSNVLMVGPAGCGKSGLAEGIAERLGLPYFFNGPIQSEFKLMGYKDANGQYHATPFRKAYEHGGVYLFDELDACSAQALVSFNTALANGVCDFPDKQVMKHPDFVCLAAANTPGTGATANYAGREKIDGATLDRFAVVKMHYDESLEFARAGNDPWVKRVHRIREIAAASYPRLIVSMRASTEGAEMLRRGFQMHEVEEMFIWRGQLTKAQIMEMVAKVGLT
jgi:hypothetical protein